jgi:hypothetical protein
MRWKNLCKHLRVSETVLLHFSPICIACLSLFAMDIHSFCPWTAEAKIVKLATVLHHILVADVLCHVPITRCFKRLAVMLHNFAIFGQYFTVILPQYYRISNILLFFSVFFCPMKNLLNRFAKTLVYGLIHPTPIVVHCNLGKGNKNSTGVKANLHSQVWKVDHTIKL